MRKYSNYNKTIVGLMIGFFLLGILGLHLEIGEANALFFIVGIILLMVWGPMPDHERYKNYPKKLQERGRR
jgi:hypothetical protein